MHAWAHAYLLSFCLLPASDSKTKGKIVQDTKPSATTWRFSPLLSHGFVSGRQPHDKRRGKASYLDMACAIHEFPSPPKQGMARSPLGSCPADSDHRHVSGARIPVFLVCSTWTPRAGRGRPGIARSGNKDVSSRADPMPGGEIPVCAVQARQKTIANGMPNCRQGKTRPQPESKAQGATKVPNHEI